MVIYGRCSCRGPQAVACSFLEDQVEAVGRNDVIGGSAGLALTATRRTPATS